MFPEGVGNNLATFLSIVSESLTLQWKIELKFLVENEIGSRVSNDGVMACLAGFHAQNTLRPDCSISLYVWKRA